MSRGSVVATLDDLAMVAKRTSPLTIRGRQETLDPGQLSILENSDTTYPTNKSRPTTLNRETRPRSDRD